MKSGKWTALLLSGVATALAMPLRRTQGGSRLHTRPARRCRPPCNPEAFTVPAPSACLLTGYLRWRLLGTDYIQRPMFVGAPSSSTASPSARSTIESLSRVWLGALDDVQTRTRMCSRYASGSTRMPGTATAARASRSTTRRRAVLSALSGGCSVLDGS